MKWVYTNKCKYNQYRIHEYCFKTKNQNQTNKQTNNKYTMNEKKQHISESMHVNEVFQKILNSVQFSNVNFHLQQTPFAATISIYNYFQYCSGQTHRKMTSHEGSHTGRRPHMTKTSEGIQPYRMTTF